MHRLSILSKRCLNGNHGYITRAFQSLSSTSMNAARGFDHSASNLALQMATESSWKEEDCNDQGYVLDIKSSVVYASGLLKASLGSMTYLESDCGESIPGVVLNLERDWVTIGVLGDTKEIKIGSSVQHANKNFSIPIGKGNFGRVVNPLGEPIDGEGDLDCVQEMQVFPAMVPGILARAPLNERLLSGFSCIDCLHPLGYGSRLAVLGERFSGKTRFALDSIQHILGKHHLHEEGKDDKFMHCVYVLIGKSRPLVNQIVEYLRATECFKFTSIVAATENDPLGVQFLAPFVGCSIAESVCLSGGNAVIVYDDLSMHQHIIDHLYRNNHKNSSFMKGSHPYIQASLLERSGKMSELKGNGSITTLALVSVDKEDASSSGFSSSIVSSTDDHVRLEPRLTARKLYPPIDCLIPGQSVKGPPFQSATLWHFVQEIKEIVREFHSTESSTNLAKQFGFHSDEEDTLEIIDYRDILEDFFSQRQGQCISSVDIELGAFVVAKKYLLYLPQRPSIWNFVASLRERLQNHCPQVLESMEGTDIHTMWDNNLLTQLDENVQFLLNQHKRNQTM